MNFDTRQLNHLVVHSVIDSLVVAPRRGARIARGSIALDFISRCGHSFPFFFSFYATYIPAMRFIRGRRGCLYHNQREIARISRLPAIREPGGQMDAAKARDERGVALLCAFREKFIRMQMIEKSIRAIVGRTVACQE